MNKTKLSSFFVLLGGAALAQVNTQSFVTSGNFVVPSGVTSLTLEVVGAGGKGGGNGGGGGGGGGYAKGVYNVTPGASIPISIGAAGGGSAGGTTSAGMLISASGGANGGTVPNPGIGGGGAGGTGNNGTIANRTGGAGGGGYWTYFGGGGGGAAGSSSNGSAGGNTIAWSGICQTPGGSAGLGGGAPGGDGGKGAGFTDPSCNITDPSGNGLSYGGGGGGANGNGGAAGTGNGGYCLVSWTGGCVPPSAPSNVTAAGNLTLCGSGATTLTATGSGVINWYTNASGGMAVGTGTAFTTPVLSSTVTYYAEANTCTNSAVRTAITITVSALPQLTISPSSTSICQGSTLNVTASGASSYSWSLYNPAQMSFSVGASNAVYPVANTSYTVTGTDVNGCKNSAVVNLTVNALPQLTLSPSSPSICAGGTVNVTASGASSYSWSVYNPAEISFSVGAGNAIHPNATTSYTVMGTDVNGCRSNATINVVVHALPSLSVTTSASVICAGQAVTISAGGANSYSWSTTATTSTIMVTPAVTTTYSVKGTDSNTCSSTAFITQFVSACTGIYEIAQEDNGLSIYPNPSHGTMNFVANRDMQLNLLNELGQLIKTYTLNAANNHQLTVSNLPVGIYFIEDTGSGQALRRKVIVSN